MTQNDEAERLARDCKTAAKCLKYEGSFETGQAILTEAAALIRTQAARIAELETKLQAVLRREEDANRAAFAHMRRITALEADGIAARKATAKNYARAEAAEKALAEIKGQLNAAK